MKKIKVADDFSLSPGFRKREDGPYSGEEFREKFLDPLFKKGKNEKVLIILDGVAGYATSFLEEAFGGLARKFGSEHCLEVLEFISEEDPYLVEEIKEYIRAADNNA